MKAAILAAGEGTRLKPITSSIPKPMIPLGGKPLLEHQIVGLKKAGIKEFLIIVGYKEDIIKQHFKKGQELGVNIDYVTQEEYRGTAHATGYAEDFIGDDIFLMMYGDILVDQDLYGALIQYYQERGADGLISLLEVKNPENYGIITLDSEQYVKGIIEKPSPDLDVGNLANAGIYIFPPQIFKAIAKTKVSERNEYELTDSIRIFIEIFNKKIVGYNIKDSYWNDIGLPWQLLDVNGYILGRINSEIEGHIEENVIIKGNIHIGKETVIKSGSYIHGPCFIGDNCIIGPNAYIRPGCSIQDNCIIGSSEVKNSIILSNSNFSHFNYIGDSIICDHVNLGGGTKVANVKFDESSVKVLIKGKRTNSNRKKLGAIIGPNVKVGINSSIMCGKKIDENCIIGPNTLVNEDIPKGTLFYQDPKKGIIKKNLT